MAGNKALKKAKSAKQDEFYTQLSDIEKEMRHYRDFFNDKVVFCNCDDPFESNFLKYFAMNFNSLGLKRLITTCYATSPIVYTQLNMFGEEIILNKEKSTKKPYKTEITEVTDENADGRIDLADVECLLRNRKNALTLLQGDGDFRSTECVELLKQADVIVTNPPFSLFREYVAQLIEYNKKFIIIGTMNAIHYKEIFPLIKENKLWIGYCNGAKTYKVAPNYSGKISFENNGIRYVKMGNTFWYTNVDIEKRHDNLVLFKMYNAIEYPTYDNYNAINIDKITDIPEDYFSDMGVPDGFLEQYNPEQFEIIGLGCGDLAKEIGITKNYRGRTDLAYTKDGKKKCPYSRIIVRRKAVNHREHQVTRNPRS